MLIKSELLKMIIGYINSNKKNIAVEKQRQDICDYAEANSLIIDDFYTYDDVLQLAENLHSGGHSVICANIVSIGGTLAQIKDNLQLLLTKGFKIVSIKENLQLESGKSAETLLNGLEQALLIMSSMMSVTAKQALADKKERGCKLGRRIGYRSSKYIWSGKEEEIKQKLLSGVTRKQTAKDTGMSIFSLYSYINQTPELKQALEKM